VNVFEPYIITWYFDILNETRKYLMGGQLIKIQSTIEVQLVGETVNDSKPERVKLR
jgi:hypothetical protein